jgi:UDP-N-acetylglucosamine:LPS N-acetylglucosamine transferase
MKPPLKQKRILAISSGGGHWTQLRRIRTAFDGHDITWATVMIDGQIPLESESDKTIRIPDATRWNKFGLVRLFLKVLYCILRVRPHVIISTGAAPGYFALLIGRLFGIKTCWIDSIANVQEMSLSGKKARKCANLWLTQWKHLASPNGPHFCGSVIPEVLPGENKDVATTTLSSLETHEPGDQSGVKTKIMTISSGGGHWVELLRLSSAVEGNEVHWVTVRKEYRTDLRKSSDSFHTINDATRWNKFGLLLLTVRITLLILKIRPKVIITTGAAPGYIAVMIGSALGARTCWIDSLANVEELSLSGKKAGRWASLWLTQWKDLANDEKGPGYEGMLFPDLTE